ncbi:MAG: hypothetical protein ACFFCT_13885 [Candidatus Odinarchaeota archaeon]
MVEEWMKHLFAYLDNISKMLAFFIIKDVETTKDKIIQLNKVGVSRLAIAEVLGVTVNHVDVTLSTARKAG